MKVAQKLLVAYFRTKLRLLSMVSSRKAAVAALDLFSTPLRRSKRKTPAIFGQAEPLRCDVAGYTLSGHRWKFPSGKKVLIVHGFESSSKNFDCYIRLLIDKGYEVVVFDAPAHGRSSGKRIDLPIYQQALARIHEQYGPFDGFISHSFGGLALAHLLETLPHSEATRAVLIAPATEMVSTINSFFRFLRLSSDVKTAFDQLILERSGYTPDHFSIRRTMHSIRARVLWFHDEDDELTPVGDALAVKEENHPHIQFRITRGLGHRRIYRDQHIVQEIVNFM